MPGSPLAVPLAVPPACSRVPLVLGLTLPGVGVCVDGAVPEPEPPLLLLLGGAVREVLPECSAVLDGQEEMEGEGVA